MILTVLLSVGNILIITFVVLLLMLYIYFRKQYKYWEEKKVPHANPVFPLGNLSGMLEKSSSIIFKNLYLESKHQRYYGIWLTYKPVLLINDPDLIKHVLIKNFENFHSNGSYFDKDNDPVSDVLFTLDGARWKNLRTKLSPIFTSGKLKSWLPNMIKCSENLQEILQEPARMNEMVDAKEFAKRFTTEVILLIFFGAETNFIKNKDSSIGLVANEIVKPSLTNGLKLFISIFVPEIARILKYSIMPKKLSDTFCQFLQDIVDYREYKNVTRNDVMQSLIELLKRGYVEDVNNPKKEVHINGEKFTFKDLASQSVMFLTGGFESSSTTIQFTLYELAKNLEIQKKLIKEIKSVLAKHDGQITYEAILEMEYLGRVMDETLRKYSITPIIMRKCVTDFKDPGSNLTIEKGTSVVVSLAGLHHDDRYYPNPEKYDPERFTKENKALRPEYSYLPFGEGPRICLGQRLGQMQVKVGLVALLSKYKFDIPEKLASKPLAFDPYAIVTAPKGKMMFKISLSDD